MSVLRRIINKLTGRKSTIQLEIKFHKEATPYGSHGRIEVSSKERNLKNANILFVFVGVSSPPALTPEVMNYIWEEAKAQGFTPHSLLVYGRVLTTDAVNAHQFLVSARVRQEEAMRTFAAR